MFKIGDRVEYVGPDESDNRLQGTIYAMSASLAKVDWSTCKTQEWLEDLKKAGHGFRSRIKAWEQSRGHARTLDVDNWRVPAVVGQTARVLEWVGDVLFPVERGER
jgi:hypothetical protein